MKFKPKAYDLGIPVKAVSWTRLHPGKTEDGRASLLATMSQNNGGFFVIDIDLRTGHCAQYYTVSPKQSTFSPASFRSVQSGVLYVCSAWDGHLHRFDANYPDRGIEDLGHVNDRATYGNGITETPDGMIWIGSYPGAFLTRFDPRTGKMKRFGRIVTDDKYLSPQAGGDGTLAAQVKSNRPRVIVIDPQTGACRQIGPSITDISDKSQFLKLYRGMDDLLYLESHEGTLRITGMDSAPVENPPPPRSGFHATYQHDYQAVAEMPGGWLASFPDININGSGVPRRLRLENRDAMIPTRELQLDWVGGGNNLHVIGVGPNGDIYGSSYLPNRLFHATATGDVVEDLGNHVEAGGQAYSMASLDGKLYLSSYPGARISVYDPDKPINYGDQPDDNPRDLGRFDTVSYRPNALIATPRMSPQIGPRLWIGSAPDFGLHGGTLAWFDPQTGASKSHRSILSDTSPSALIYLSDQNQILVGLSIEVGTGATVQRKDAAFALWDPVGDDLVWSGDLGIEDLADPVAFAPAGSGLIYAMLGRGDQILAAGAPRIGIRIALIDPATRKLVSISWLPEDYGPMAWHGHFSLKVGPRGVVYGATGYCFFRIKPGTCDVERIWQPDSPPPPNEDPVWLTHSTPDAIDVPGPIIGNRFYFSTGWRLRVLEFSP